MFRLTILVMIILSGVLAAETKVLSISGSTREASLNKQLAKEAARIAAELGTAATFIDLRDYPIALYDGDLEARQGMPPRAARLRKLMVDSDVIVIATPEYNGSISAVLKNFLDWASRSESGKPSREAFKGKKFALLSASPGPGGGQRAVAHLKQIIENVGGTVVSPQLSVPNATTDLIHSQKVQQQLKDELREALK